MKIEEIKILRGPNYWSVRRPKLIQMKLNLEELEQKPTNTIEGFRERLEKLFPSMYSHRCSVGKPGGFFQRVEEGTWMGHVIEHIALELQTLAGMNCGFGRTRGTGQEGEYYVVFNYMEEDAGVYAAKASVRIAQSLVDGSSYDLSEDIQRLREIREDTRLGPSTGCIVEEAAKRGIPYIRLNKQSLVQLGYGVHQKRIRATIASTTSNIAVDIACDKEETKNLLEAAEIPVPKGTVIRTEIGLEEAVAKFGYPLVIKPIDGNHGKGNTTNITNWEQALRAFEAAKQYSRSVIVEKFITGVDFRVLVINYKFVCAALRTPASVIGDGVHSIQWLIDETNKDSRRGYGHEKVLTQITIDQFTQKMLDEKGYTLETIPPKDELVGKGISGNKVYDLFLRMEEDVLKLQPHIVVIYIGVNDIWHKSMMGTGTDYDKFGKFYQAIVDKMKAAGIQVILCTPAVIGERYDGTNPQDGELNHYSNWIRNYAADNHLSLVDLRAAFLNYSKTHNPNNQDSRILTYDRVHLNDAGNKLVAEQMWEKIKTIK